jgi:hypothetical protein
MFWILVSDHGGSACGLPALFILLRERRNFVIGPCVVADYSSHRWGDLGVLRARLTSPLISLHRNRSSEAGYGTIMMGVCQNVAFWLAGSSTVTWQSYLPGGSGLRSMVKLIGATCRWVLVGGVTSSGCVS